MGRNFMRPKARELLVPDRDVLYEDNHLLIVHKPPGLATMGTDGTPTLFQWAGDYLKRKYNKPGNVYVGVVSRLDQVTSGAIVLARTSKAASRLSAQFAKHDLDHSGSTQVAPAVKIYIAVITGSLRESSGTIESYVIKDDAAHRMRVVPANVAGAKRATLKYCVLDSDEEFSVVAIRLLTGRKHQIRLQLGHAGYPIVADRKYGADMTVDDRLLDGGIALHSWFLQIEHPTRKEPVAVCCPVPDAWRKRFRALCFPSELRSDITTSLELPLISSGSDGE